MTRENIITVTKQQKKRKVLCKNRLVNCLEASLDGSNYNVICENPSPVEYLTCELQKRTKITDAKKITWMSKPPVLTGRQTHENILRTRTRANQWK